MGLPLPLPRDFSLFLLLLSKFQRFLSCRRHVGLGDWGCSRSKTEPARHHEVGMLTAHALAEAHVQTCPASIRTAHMVSLKASINVCLQEVLAY